MAGLAETVLGSEQTDRVVADCVQLLERYVGERGGFKGISLKTGVAMLKAKRPDLLAKVSERLLPQFLAALEPLYAAYRSETPGAAGFRAYLLDHRAAAQAALLRVADERVAAASNPLVKKTYGLFRDDAGKEVDLLLPGFGALVDRYLPRAQPAGDAGQ